MLGGFATSPVPKARARVKHSTFSPCIRPVPNMHYCEEGHLKLSESDMAAAAPKVTSSVSSTIDCLAL